MKKAILFLVALILLSFISNACIGNPFHKCKTKNATPAILPYNSNQACSHFQIVSTNTSSSKAGLSICTPASLTFALGIVANTRQDLFYSELHKLIPSPSNGDKFVLKTKHKQIFVQNASLSANAVKYNYLTCAVKTRN